MVMFTQLYLEGGGLAVSRDDSSDVLLVESFFESAFPVQTFQA